MAAVTEGASNRRRNVLGRIVRFVGVAAVIIVVVEVPKSE